MINETKMDKLFIWGIVILIMFSIGQALDLQMTDIYEYKDGELTINIWFLSIIVAIFFVGYVFPVWVILEKTQKKRQKHG